MSCTSNCVISASGSKTPTGITVSLTGSFSSIPDTIDVGDYTLELKSISRISPVKYTLTYSTDFTKYIIGSAVFKVIPKTIYDALEKYDQIAKLVSDLSPISSPSNVFIKTTEDDEDVYAQNTGFSPSEIFSTFGIEVIYPPCLEYKITELIIKNGMSVAALIHSVFPIPGTIIFLDDTTIEFSIEREDIYFYINSNTLNWSYSKQEEHYSATVTGMQSEPRNIVYTGEKLKVTDSYDSNTGNSATISVIYNIFGKVYGVIKEEYVVQKVSVPDFTTLEQFADEGDFSSLLGGE